PDGDDPLDSSAVHPEAYPVVRRILSKTGTDIRALIGNTRTLSSLRPAEFVDDTFGLPTVTDILSELDKPGRDPRPAFKTAPVAAVAGTAAATRAARWPTRCGGPGSASRTRDPRRPPRLVRGGLPRSRHRQPHCIVSRTAGSAALQGASRAVEAAGLEVVD